ncbi:MAG: TfoX/Sxy family protein [Verrucomicrobiales bacterium]|nr:TfoX/Sxy family protein [Verrucomicrobiales bacterium]
MAYDSQLADRIRRVFEQKGVAFEAKAMMGGLCFMVNGKMCVGVADHRLMARIDIDPDQYADALTKPGCKPMDFTGRPMKGFVFVEPDGIRTARQLASWLELALAFNPKEKASKKRSR